MKDKGNSQSLGRFQKLRKDVDITEFRNYYIRLTILIDKDWKYYSRSYRFPKVTVERRYITFFNKNGKTYFEIDVPNFKRNWFFNVLSSFYKLTIEEKSQFIINEEERINFIRFHRLKNILK